MALSLLTYEQYSSLKEISHIELANLICEKLGFQKADYLNQGSNGCVYSISNNLVLKLTNDVKEAKSATFLNQSQYNGICNIYSVYKLHTSTYKLVSNMFRFPYINELYAIIVQKATDTDKASMIISSIQKYLIEKTDKLNSKKFASLVLKYKEAVEKEKDENFKKYYFQLVDIINELKSNDIISLDMHEQNFGFINDKLVVFDILINKSNNKYMLTMEL